MTPTLRLTLALILLSLLLSACKPEAASPLAAPTQPPTLAAPSAGSTQTRPTDGMVMVFVPSGEFQMGSDNAQVDRALEMCNQYYGKCERSWFEVEQPQHAVRLDSFWLDRTEVTNAQYQRCVKAGKCTPPGSEGSPTRAKYFGESAYDSYPVLFVDWHQANAYCTWAGARLPTEAEWEYAARGPEGRVYPWGNEYDAARLNSCDAGCGFDWEDKAAKDGYADTAPVGSYPVGASWSGAFDLAGNAWEWMGDWYGDYPAGRQTNPTGPASGTLRVLRGDAADGTRSVSRSAARHGETPSRPYEYTGFRCAVRASP